MMHVRARPLTSSIFVALGVLIPQVAQADDHTAGDHLDAGRHVGYDTAPNADVNTPGFVRNFKHTLFVNMDGANLTATGIDNAHNNETVWSNYGGAFPAYGSEADKAAVLDIVRATYSEYGINIVGERPTDPGYTMVMLGPSGHGGGWATLDCGNHNPSNIGFVDASPSWGAGSNAAIVAHEAGHTFGLEHVDNYDYVMAPTIYEGAYFASDCAGLLSSTCSLQHQEFCASGQNAHLELLEMFGNNIPDTAPPEVAITDPTDGANVPQDFPVVVEASDDVGVTTITLMVDGEAVHTKGVAPWTWDLVGVPLGPHELQVLARDDAGNETVSDAVDVTVTDGSDSGGTFTSGDSGDGDGDGDGDTTATGGDLPGADDGTDSGCGCRSTGPAGAGWVFALGVLFFHRRR